MTKAQEIQDAHDTLETISHYIKDIGGNITPDHQRILVEMANRCHVVLGHPTPYKKAKTQIGSLISNARSAKKDSQNQA